MDDLPEQLRGLTGYQNNASQMGVLMKAAEEIERLRASQFRWIPVGEIEPAGPVFAVHKSGSVGVVSGGIIGYGYTHYGLIPPLPEKSQADRDDEMLRVWIKSLGAEHTDRENSLRIGYLQGLKAAREEKA